MAGYSQTPRFKKLGLKPMMSAHVINTPAHYYDLLGESVEDVKWVKDRSCRPAFVHLFTDSKSTLREELVRLRGEIATDGMMWVSWPKKASKVPTDITEDAIREICLPLGLVDVKVCAVDHVWSGLKLVIRKERH